MAENLAHADWAARTYLPAADMAGMQLDASLLQIGAAIGRGVSHDIAERTSFPSVEALEDFELDDFLAAVGDPAEASAWLASTSRRTVAEQLGAARLLIQRYLSNDGSELPDDVAFWRAAAPAALRIAGDLGAVKLSAVNSSSTTENATMTDTTAMSDDDFEDAVEDVRKQITEAQGMGNSRKANKLYQREQELLATRGNAPVVGRGGRSF